jgi:PAS domain S-box-containing protein
MPLTWSDIPEELRRPLDRTTIVRELRGYAIAFGSVALAIGITRVAWPMLNRLPFGLLFAATFLSARFATETSSLVAVVVAALSAQLMVPSSAAGSLPGGAVLTFVGVAFAANRMVMARNHAEAALRASEAQFRAAWDNSAFGAALLDARGMVERINPAMERTLGFASAAWRGVSFAHFVVVNEVADARARFAAFMTDEAGCYERETRFRRSDGSTIWGRLTMSAVRDPKGVHTGALMVIEDVSRRRIAEDELRASEARFRTLFDEVPVGLFQCGVDGRINVANRALLRMLGEPSTETMRDMRVTDLVATRAGQTLIDNAMSHGRNLRSLLAPLRCRDHNLTMVTIDMRAVRYTGGGIGHYDGTIVEAPKGSIAVPATGM